MTIKLKRAYEIPDPDDGYRVLVDRLWPRGISKSDARIDAWLKDIAPTDALRRAFHSGTLDWEGFRKRYLSEIEAHHEILVPLVQRSRNERVTLVFSAKDVARNNAVVLRQYLDGLAVELSATQNTTPGTGIGAVPGELP